MARFRFNQFSTFMKSEQDRCGFFFEILITQEIKSTLRDDPPAMSQHTDKLPTVSIFILI